MRKTLIPKGFTLLEILIVVTIVGILSVAAIGGLVRTQDHFSYKSAINQSVNAFKEIRSMALGNATVPSVPSNPNSVKIVPFQYGIHLNDAENKLTIFADMPDTGIRWQFDDPATSPGGEEDYVFDEYTLPDKYDYKVQNETDDEQDISATIFYEPTTAVFNITPADTFDGRFVSIKISEKDNPNRIKYIVFFKLSGSPEEMESIDDL